MRNEFGVTNSQQIFHSLVNSPVLSKFDSHTRSTNRALVIKKGVGILLDATFFWSKVETKAPRPAMGFKTEQKHMNQGVEPRKNY